MEIADFILSAVQSVGFPAVMCGVLLYLMYRQTEQHKSETDKMTEAINNNTVVLQRILERLGGVSNDQ